MLVLGFEPTSSYLHSKCSHSSSQFHSTFLTVLKTLLSIQRAVGGVNRPADCKFAGFFLCSCTSPQPVCLFWCYHAVDVTVAMRDGGVMPLALFFVPKVSFSAFYCFDVGLIASVGCLGSMDI